MAAKIEKEKSAANDSYLNEIIAIGILVIAVLLLLCLASYNSNDPSIITSSSQKTVNWIGVVGANVAAILFSSIGLAAYVLPFLTGLIAWRVFRSENLHVSFSRAIGFVLFVISTAGLLNLFLENGFRGGILGALTAQSLISILGIIGTAIVLIAAFLISSLLITSVSYFLMFTGLKNFWEKLVVRFKSLKTRFSEWQQKQKEAALLRAEKRREKRDDEKQIISDKKPTITVAEKPKIAAVESKTSIAENVKTAVSAATSAPLLKNLKEARLEKNGKQNTGELKIGEPFEEPPAEKTLPKITPTLEMEFSGIKEDDPLEFLNNELEPISIAPIRQTGDLKPEDLNREAIKNTDAPEAKFVESKFSDDEKSKPQNFENYQLPTTGFLIPAHPKIEQKDESLLAIAEDLTQKTKEFNVTGTIKHISPGPVVTTYEFKPDPGVKYSRITGLADDLCLALKAESIRIDRIPGKAHVGIEVPNHIRETIQLREVIESQKFRNSESRLTIALGKGIDGLNYVADLAKMPHLLIAGATGAGKSVGVNTLIVSILYKAKPDEVKFIMVDPKQVELGIYADIPHLATPIITDPKRAAISLKWAVSEMERRYKDLAGFGVRNIDGYNAEVKRRIEREQFDDNGEPHKNLPYIIIIIDELADLMMVAGKEVEESITRLAQMARAVGIHLVLATQRPSVDVITGLIKANFPARISFRVSSKIDSRTIIDANGAERLLGRGDMLFLPPATSQIVRVHGAFVDEKEIAKIVNFVKEQGRPEYDTTITKTEDELDDSADLPGKRDPLFLDAVRCVVQNKGASTSLLQRYLRIGYGRAAAILDAMAREGFIGEPEGGKRARPVLEKAYEFLEGYDSVDNS